MSSRCTTFPDYGKIAVAIGIALAFATFARPLPAGAATGETTQCSDGGTFSKVCGIPVPEDLVPVPGTSWLIASSMPRDGSAGGLYLVETRSRRVEPVTIREATGNGNGRERAPDRTEACAPPDPAKWITHGISIVEGSNGVHRLFVVAHGGREAIELFTVHTHGAQPEIFWTGCVKLPDGLEANSVAGLPGGGFLFTSLYDQGDADWKSRMDKLGSASPAGGVYEWDDAKGIRRIDAPAMSGPNGIAVSPDGKSVFLAGWGDRRLRRIDRAGRETAPSIALDFLPDNLHWAPDGTLLAAGQRATVAQLFGCTTGKEIPDFCVRSYSVASISAETLEVVKRWEQPIASGFGDSTAAVLLDGAL